MEQIERISKMEERLNKVNEAIHELSTALEKYQSVRNDIQILNEYLGSKEWRSDLQADEDGLLLQNLNRGVLSEDGIWNTIEANRELLEKINKFVNRQQKP